jgi:peptidoglycan/xylan/chitin deacetylase (PgdA/CDA1 family)
MYHRVASLDADPWRLCVAPARFAEHLDVIRRSFEPTSLRRLASALARGRVPDRAVVVTFDDGYADLVEHARPLLERFDVPATAFLVSGAVGSGREYWWDELEGLLLRPGALPESLALELDGVSYGWDLGASARYVDADFQANRGWCAWGEPDPSPRHAAYRSVWELLQPLPHATRREALDLLRGLAGTPADARRTHRTLAPGEVADLARGGLVEIGAHTVTHSALAHLPADAQRREIAESRRELEEIAGRPVTSFAYPYGRRCDYTDETAALVRAEGFACACSNFDGIIRAYDDRYQLPRIHAHDWNGDELEQHLSYAFRDR